MRSLYSDTTACSKWRVHTNTPLPPFCERHARFFIRPPRWIGQLCSQRCFPIPTYITVLFGIWGEDAGRCFSRADNLYSQDCRTVRAWRAVSRRENEMKLPRAKAHFRGFAGVSRFDLEKSRNRLPLEHSRVLRFVSYCLWVVTWNSRV